MKALKDIYGAIIIAIFIVSFSFKTKTENFTVLSRPNKCFDCEKEITSEEDAHLAFPTRCVDCEKEYLANKKIAYKTGPTKCFSCEEKYKNKKNDEFLSLQRDIDI